MLCRDHLGSIVAVAISSATQAGTALYVDDDNCPGPGNGTPGDPYCSIQTAIDDALDEDEIIVAPGTYFETINFLGKAVWLHSSDGPEVTIIDANGMDTVVRCISGEASDTALDGFTITGGGREGGGDEVWGGGMYNIDSSPTVTDCTFAENASDEGTGGMANFNSKPTVTNCTFLANDGSSGGGMYNYSSDPVVTDCMFSGNIGAGGGGIANFASDPTVRGCTFIGNTAGGSGGGMSNWDESDPLVEGCTFTGNVALTGAGGAMYNVYSSPSIINCTFDDNTAEAGHGGGIFDLAGFNTGGNAVVVSCTFSGNSALQGGAVYIQESSPTVTDCAFIANWAFDTTGGSDGGGMSNWSSSPTVVNCTFVDNSVNGSLAGSGGGMGNILGSTTVLDCRLRGNWSSSAGGGMANFANSPTVTNCTLRENLSDVVGGGMYNYESSPTVTSCVFDGNEAGWGGGMRDAFSSPTMTNCVFRGNRALQQGGGADFVGSGATVADCTFSGNEAADGNTIGFMSDPSELLMANCILWSDDDDGEILNDNGSALAITYTDVRGGWPGTGNIDDDPMFADSEDGDVRLRAGSPCIDGGDNAAVPNGIRRDADGNPRIAVGSSLVYLGSGPIVDMGAYEYQLDPLDRLIPGDFGTGDTTPAGVWRPLPPQAQRKWSVPGSNR